MNEPLISRLRRSKGDETKSSLYLSRQNASVSSSSNAQVSDAQALEIKFMDSIAKTQELKSEVHKKIGDYEKKLELVEIERHSLESMLRKEQLKCREFEMKSQELTEKITTFTDLNESLAKVNGEMKNQLQQCQDKMNDLDKTCQKLLAEKASFNKNFNDRLKAFINGVSISETDNLEMISATENVEESVQNISTVQNNNKRIYEVDLDMSLIHEENPAIRRRVTSPTTIDPVENSSDPHDISIDNHIYVQKYDPVEVFETDFDVRNTQMNDDNIGANADSTNNVVLDCGDANDENPVNQEFVPGSPLNERRKFRKNINKVMDFENLAPETKLAYRREKERKQQYVQRIQKYNETYGTLPGELNKLNILLLDFDLNTKRELLAVNKKLSIKLKPHQCQGVKFMWDACFESVEKLKSSDGGGCILGHCMGLGKTLQVIALVHTLLTHSTITNVEKVLIVCPVNVILNWVDEFQMWLEDFRKRENIKIYELSMCDSVERIKRIKSWQKNGGVFIIGYHMFKDMKKNLQSDTYHKAFIDPGADLVVCDEGHLLKNPASQLSLALNKIRTMRRIVLTGTPLQNNLKEYFSMVEFVKPKLLGTEKEFNNGFVRPIENGQFIDSTDEDIMLMKYRSYILHKLLEGCVQRRDYSVLAEFLPPKQEHVLFIRLTKLQIDLYKFYVENIAKGKPIADLPSLRRVCNHPKVLSDFEEHKNSKACKDVTVEKNVTAISDTESELDENVEENNEWWKPIICGGAQLELSGKMLILSSILSECEDRGDKLLVFSSSLSTINVIEHFLAKMYEGNRKLSGSSSKIKGTWTRDVDYLRLDGTTNVEKRKRDIIEFNKESNKRARLFLISTKAGGLGINLMAANRVVIFDPSWNPSDDIQSIFRTYRIGQKKECYVYRFIALGTIEEKIYDRQVSKLSIAKRVIDEHQISRHYKEEDLLQLYCVKNIDPPTVEHQTSTATKDNLLNALLEKHRDVIFKHHDHDSLLENMTEETLTDQETDDVWGEFDTSENDIPEE